MTATVLCMDDSNSLTAAAPAAQSAEDEAILHTVRICDVVGLAQILGNDVHAPLLARDEQNRTPLMIAAFAGFEIIVRMLLMYNKNASFRTGYVDAAQLARQAGHTNVAELIEGDLQEFDGQNPYCLMFHDGREELSMQTSSQVNPFAQTGMFTFNIPDVSNFLTRHR